MKPVETFSLPVMTRRDGSWSGWSGGQIFPEIYGKLNYVVNYCVKTEKAAVCVNYCTLILNTHIYIQNHRNTYL